MKKSCCIIGLFGILSLFAGPVMGADASVELGKKLFEDPALGGSINDAKCSGCHPGGQGLEQSGAKDNLAGMINFCIEKPLKGRKLPDNSVELESLKMFIKSLK